MRSKNLPFVGIREIENIVKKCLFQSVFSFNVKEIRLNKTFATIIGLSFLLEIVNISHFYAPENTSFAFSALSAINRLGMGLLILSAKVAESN